MNSLFLIVFTTILLYLTIKKSVIHGLIISPLSSIVLVVSFSVFFPSVLYLDVLSDDYLIFYIVVISSLLIFIVFFNDSYWFSQKLKRDKKYKISNSVIVIFSSIYFFFLLSEILSLIINHGGIVNAFSRDRLVDYLGGGIRSGSFSQFAMIIPSISYFIMIGIFLNEKKNLRAVFLVVFLVFYYSITANTRLPIIMPIAALVIYYLFFNKNMFVKKNGVLIVLFSVVFVSFFSFFANLLRHGIFDLQGSVLLSMHEQNLNQLKYPLWIDELLKVIDRDELSFSYGFNWFVTPFLNIIPRYFWNDKPLTSTSNILSEEVYGITVGDGSPITTFTIWGEAYWQFGFVGVFFAVFLFYFIFKVLCYFYASYKNTEFYMIYVLINWVPFVRAEMPMFYLLTSLISLFFLVFISNVIVFFNNRVFK